MIQLTNQSITLLFCSALLITGCSSNSDQSSGSDNVILADGPPANTGIARQAPASTESFTAARPELIDLDYLTDSNGFSRSIESATDTFGRDLRALGDVNGDDLPDFAFSTSKSTVFIYGGGESLNNLDFTNLSDSAGFTINYPISVEGIGDINDDGIGDIAWITYDAIRDATGVRVIFGTQDGTLKQAILAPAKGVDGLDISNSVRLLDIRTVASAGDLNDDGIGDLFIGGFGLNGVDHTAPNAWVIYGSQSIGNADIEVSQLALGQGLTLISPLTEAQLNAKYDNTGTGYDASIASDFDLNGDGIDDIAFGTHRFDWINITGETRTYIVFGSTSRTSDVVDMNMLDGENGLRITSLPVTYFPDPDRIVSLGDLDGNGFNDLAILSNSISFDSTGLVLFSGTGITGSVVERSTIPAGSAMHILDSDTNRNIEYLSAVGDLDGDGNDELGLVFSAGHAAILYGDEGNRPDSIDLNMPSNIDITFVQGMSDSYTLIDDNPLHALGDINNDGVDDLGIGWDRRAYEAGISVIDDINDDNINDLQISPTNASSVSLLRVLYGFDASGFTGVLGGLPNTESVALVEEDFFNALISSVDATSNFAINTLNDMLTNGTDLGATASACLNDANGDQPIVIDRFNCTANPIVFSYGWGGGKYSGTAEMLFTSASMDGSTAKTLTYGSAPLPTGAPGVSPFNAFVSYDVDGLIELSNGIDATSDTQPKRVSCTIDVKTRITQDNADICLSLIRSTTLNLEALFGSQSTIREITLLP